MTPDRIHEIFRGINLEENHNFLEDDLIKLARAYAEEGAKEERASCIAVAKAYNHMVAERISKVRDK